MFTIEVTETIEAAHQLALPYESKCNTPHGHSYRFVVEIETDQLDDNCMVVDFSDVKAVLRRYDHKNLNGFFNPTTAERFAVVLFHEIAQMLATKNPHAFILRVSVSETGTTWVHYKP